MNIGYMLNVVLREGFLEIFFFEICRKLVRDSFFLVILLGKGEEI